MKKPALFLVVLTVLSIFVGCSSSDKSNSKSGNSAEEVAREFVVSVVSEDANRFAKCVHPNMLEEWADSFHVDLSNDSATTVDPGVTTSVYRYSTVTGEDFESIKDSLSSEFSIKATEAMVYVINAEFYDYHKNETVNYQWSVEVFYAEGRWYALGWS